MNQSRALDDVAPVQGWFTASPHDAGKPRLVVELLHGGRHPGWVIGRPVLGTSEHGPVAVGTSQGTSRYLQDEHGTARHIVIKRYLFDLGDIRLPDSAGRPVESHDFTAVTCDRASGLCSRWKRLKVTKDTIMVSFVTNANGARPSPGSRADHAALRCVYRSWPEPRPFPCQGPGPSC